jgi:hypothetical protein
MARNGRMFLVNIKSLVHMGYYQLLRYHDLYRSLHYSGLVYKMIEEIFESLISIKCRVWD